MSSETELDYKQAFATEQKKNSVLEILFEQKTHELYQANQQLKAQQKTIIKSEKLASVGRLAAGLAHEINNPLTFVLSNLEILKHEVTESNDNNKDEYLDLLDDVMEGAERIKSIVKNVNNFSRTKESERKELNLNQAILSSLHLIKNRLVNKVTIKTELAEIPTIYGNLNEIKQALLNLFINAVDALEASGKPIEDRELSVVTRLDETFGFIVLSISDTGTGIEEADSISIFDPFFSTKGQGEGSGLGLYVAHEIIKAHGGSIDVESNVGEGTTFNIRLPMELRNRQSNDSD